MFDAKKSYWLWCLTRLHRLECYERARSIPWLLMPWIYHRPTSPLRLNVSVMVIIVMVMVVYSVVFLRIIKAQTVYHTEEQKLRKASHDISSSCVADVIPCKHAIECQNLGAVSIRKTVLPGMAIPMLKIRRPNGRLIFNMEIAIRR